MLKPVPLLLCIVWVAGACNAPDQGPAAGDPDHRPGLEGDTAPDASAPMDTAGQQQLFDNKSGTPPPAPH